MILKHPEIWSSNSLGRPSMIKMNFVSKWQDFFTNVQVLNFAFTDMFRSSELSRNPPPIWAVYYFSGYRLFLEAEITEIKGDSENICSK